MVFLTWRVLLRNQGRLGLTVCRLLLRHLFQVFYSRCHGALFFPRRRAWGTPATRLSGNAETFAVMPHARRKKSVVSSKNGSACGEASGIRRDTDGDHQKKLMKNKILIEAAAPANASQLSSNKQAGFVRHCANRRLSTEKVLNHLRTQLPSQYELAEVVGKWVWLDVSPARKPMLAKALWALGFHWNQRRGVWQHPCGRFDPLGSHPTDPRAKYRCYFPADILPA